MALRDLIFRIRSRFDSTGTDQAKQATQEVEGATSNLRDAVERLGTAYGAAFAAQQVLQAADTARQAELLAAATGLSASQTFALGEAFTEVGGDLSDVRGIIVGLQSAIKEAQSGSAAFAETFRELGLDANLLVNVGIDEAVLQLVNALDRAGDPTNRIGLASQLLGDDDGAKVIASLGDIRKAVEDTPTISDAVIGDASEFDESFEAAKGFFRELGVRAAATVGGGIQAFSDPANESTEAQFIRWLFGGNLRPGYVDEEQLNQAIGTIEARISQYGDIAAFTQDRTREGWNQTWRRINDGNEEAYAAMEKRTQEFIDFVNNQFELFAANSIGLARRVESAWLRAQSFATGQTGNPAAQGSIGGLGLEGDITAFESSLPQIRIDTAERGLQENAPAATEETNSNFPEGVL